MIDAEKLIREAVAKLLKQQESASTQKSDAFEGFLAEISMALTEMIGLMEKDDDGKMAAALTAGLKALRIEVAAPNVTLSPTINVSPTPIANHFHAPPAAAPVVHVFEREKDGAKSVHDVEFKYAHGIPVGMTITKR